jgi:hypothetical protein
MRQHPLIGIYYIFNLLIAAMLVWPIINTVDKLLGQRRAGEQLFGQVDFTILVQLAHEFFGSFPILPILISSVFIFMAVAIFISSGTIVILSEKTYYNTARFCQGSISYYMRFLRIFILFLLSTGVMSFLYMIFSVLIIAVFGISFLPALFIVYIICLGMILMFFDYSRIFVVLQNQKKIRHSFIEAFRFIAHRFFSVLFLYLLYGLPLLLLLLLHMVLPDLHQMGNLIAFIYGQLFIVVRSYLRLSLLAGQTVFVQDAGHQLQMYTG